MNINISAAQLRRAADIKDQIEQLEGVVNGILNPPPQPNLENDANPVRKVVRWTPERLRKFKRTMRLKRQGLK